MTRQEFCDSISHYSEWKLLRELFTALYLNDNIKITIRGKYIVGSFASDNWNYFSRFTQELLDEQPKEEPIALIVREFTPLKVNGIPLKRISGIVLLHNGYMFLDEKSIKKSFDTTNDTESFLHTHQHFAILNLKFILDKYLGFI